MVHTLISVSKPDKAERGGPLHRPEGSVRPGAGRQHPGAEATAFVRVDVIGDSLREKALLAWEAFLSE